MRCAHCGFSPCACGDEAYGDDAFIDRSEDMIIGHQYNVIKDFFGKEVADKANYGWGVDEVSGSVETKIYLPDRRRILTTRIETKFVDDWSE